MAKKSGKQGVKSAKKAGGSARPKVVKRSGSTSGAGKTSPGAKKKVTKSVKTAKSKAPQVKSKPVAKTAKKTAPAKPVTKKPVAAKQTAPVSNAPVSKPKTKPVPPAAKPAPVTAKPTIPVKPAPVTAKPTIPVKPAPVAAKPTIPAKPVPVAAKPQVGQKPAPIPSKPAPPSPAEAAAAAAKAKVVRPGIEIISKVKPLSRKFLFDVCQAIREVVEPLARAVKGREIVSTAQSGDATFEIDRVAEKALLMYLRREKAAVAYYSEDSGYSTFSNIQPTHLLVVDPIDGTRAAKSGFEGCVISVASTRVIERPTIADLDNACVMEIMSGRTFYAERGDGARIYTEGHVRKPRLSQNTHLESLCWSMTVPARPAELTFPTAARLIDLTSLKGGFFACNSTSFSLTRLLTEQQDAYVDFASRFMKDVPELVRDAFINAGRGAVLGICPYDMAAAVLIAQEAGCVVTDAYGRGFNEVLLLDSTEHNHQSMIAASNPELHEKLFRFFDVRIQQFEQLLRRRQQRKEERERALSRG